MRATLEFDLPEDSDALREALRGSAYLAALRGLRRHLRDKLKYDDALAGRARTALEDVRNLLVEELADIGEID